jgi:PIN domain nuclease of toxin-antitoxin system
MRLLLDTHILLWWLGSHPRLSRAARDTIIAAEEVYVSAVAAWEIEIKVSLGKLEFRGDLAKHIDNSGFRALPISLRHAIAAGQLPQHHKDLFDRMLIAQGQTERLTILSVDATFRTYDVDVVLV